MTPTATMRGHVPPVAAAGPAAEVTEEQPGSAQEPQEDAADDDEQDALPKGVTDDGSSWVVTLQHRLAPAKDDVDGSAFSVLRLRKTVYGKDVLAAARSGGDDASAMVAYAASLSGMRIADLERLHMRDFAVLSTLVRRIVAESARGPK